MRTLIVGLGRAGLGLHWGVIRRLRAQRPDLFADAPALAYDKRDVVRRADRAGMVLVDSLAEARRLSDPAETIVHLCTTPTARLEPLRELADLGYRQIMVEKPLAADARTLREIAELRRSRDLRLAVVAHWLDSALTRRLAGLVRSEELGRLRSISITQNKPRLRRTLESATNGHQTAFDVEVPHSLGVVLRIAGNASVSAAGLTDMKVGSLVVPWMGNARLVLGHDAGPRTEIFSDLSSPVRERRIELEFTGGSAVGHYAGSEDDHYAQLQIARNGAITTHVFPDDALSSFFVRVYRDFARGASFDEELGLATRVVELIGQAKSMSLRADPAVDSAVANAVDPAADSVGAERLVEVTRVAS
jgi:predicted dehydrogenase